VAGDQGLHDRGSRLWAVGSRMLCLVSAESRQDPYTITLFTFYIL
jgi:hypothetical protein